MKYMLLIYGAPALEPSFGTAEFDAMMAKFSSVSEKMAADGVMLGGEELHDVQNATSLRIRGGKVETMDGPFAEVREHLGGYYIVDVPDLDSALRYAAMIPVAEWGTIVVRPVREYNEAEGQ